VGPLALSWFEGLVDVRVESVRRPSLSVLLGGEEVFPLEHTERTKGMKWEREMVRMEVVEARGQRGGGKTYVENRLEGIMNDDHHALLTIEDRFGRTDGVVRSDVVSGELFEARSSSFHRVEHLPNSIPGW
jgi:hypothetical protein